jgi:hypothetical protein
MADFVPNTEGGLQGWLVNLKTKTPNRVTELAITPARLTKILAWCDALIAAMQAAEQKKNDAQAASQTKQTQMNTSLGGLRAEIAKWKTEDGLTDAIAAELQIVGSSTAFDAEGYKPQFTAQVFSGYVRIKFKKLGADGIILNSRLKGTTGWKFVSRDTNSPYDDHTPLAVAGVAEAREYQAFGVLNDEQIGQPSDIVSVAFAG